jgi:hypothetical protein
MLSVDARATSQKITQRAVTWESLMKKHSPSAFRGGFGKVTVGIPRYVVPPERTLASDPIKEQREASQSLIEISFDLLKYMEGHSSFKRYVQLI